MPFKSTLMLMLKEQCINFPPAHKQSYCFFFFFGWRGGAGGGGDQKGFIIKSAYPKNKCSIMNLNFCAVESFAGATVSGIKSMLGNCII